MTSPVAWPRPRFTPAAKPRLRSDRTARTPSFAAAREATPPSEPLSTTMTSSAWARTEARQRASQSPGRWHTTTTDDVTGAARSSQWEVRVVLPEAFDETVEGDVVGGDGFGLLALADDDRVGRLGPGADRRPDGLPAVFVDQAAELLELRIISPPGHRSPLCEHSKFMPCMRPSTA